MTLLSSIIHYAVMLTSYGLGTRLPATLAGIVMCGTDELCEVANIAARVHMLNIVRKYERAIETEVVRRCYQTLKD